MLKDDPDLLQKFTDPMISYSPENSGVYGSGCSEFTDFAAFAAFAELRIHGFASSWPYSQRLLALTI